MLSYLQVTASLQGPPPKDGQSILHPYMSARSSGYELHEAKCGNPSSYVASNYCTNFDVLLSITNPTVQRRQITTCYAMKFHSRIRRSRGC